MTARTIRAVDGPPVSELAILHSPPPSLAIREDEFEAWFRKATAGAHIEYHRGNLGIDRQRISSPFSERCRHEFAAIADRALALAEAGRLFLVQERHGDNDFSYIAVMATSAPVRRRAA